MAIVVFYAASFFGSFVACRCMRPKKPPVWFHLFWYQSFSFFRLVAYHRCPIGNHWVFWKLNHLFISRGACFIQPPEVLSVVGFWSRKQSRSPLRLHEPPPAPASTVVSGARFDIAADLLLRFASFVISKIKSSAQAEQFAESSCYCSFLLRYCVSSGSTLRWEENLHLAKAPYKTSFYISHWDNNIDVDI